MILPERVLGRSGTTTMCFGLATGPIDCATCARRSAGVTSARPDGVTNALAHRRVAPAEVGRGEHDAVEVDDTRGTDADTQERCGGAGDQLAGEVSGHIEGGFAGDFPRCLAVNANHDVAVEGHHGTAEEVRLRQIDADDLVAFSVDVDQGRGLARPTPLAKPLLGDDAIVDQFGNEV